MSCDIGLSHFIFKQGDVCKIPGLPDGKNSMGYVCKNLSFPGKGLNWF